MSDRFLYHEECPKCGSKDNLAVYQNGGRHCFSPDCDYHVNGETGEETEVSTPSNLNMGGVVAEITDRRLSAKTTQVADRHRRQKIQNRCLRDDLQAIWLASFRAEFGN